MLKALELVGFKSFADRTRFEFSRGVTGVVGPNGSGKSNVVDAIKWVLGEQSVRSLRGKEMADVIFNGSASRAPVNTAETTLTFDNSERRLPIDTPEVHITRRVYRNGEGEYLINREVCRLRDIRELMAGTGASGEAYSIIEQGKVDIMLQSSARERRLIFEEAAGISRFKAKKLESLRRLERVEQNLIRLADIVAEVESRVRSVRLQASKARRYQEHASQLQRLRTQVGLVDWRTLSAKLTAHETEAQQVAAEQATAAAEAEAAETRTRQADHALAELDDRLREIEGRLAHVRARQASCQATIAHEAARHRELEEEISRGRTQLAAMSVRAGDLRQQLEQTLDALLSAEATHATIESRLAEDQAQLQSQNSALAALNEQSEVARTARVEVLRRLSALDSAIEGLEAQIETSTRDLDVARTKALESGTAETTLRQEHESLNERLREFDAAVEARETDLAGVRKRMADYRRHHTARSNELNQLRQRHSGASERAAVLAELESRFEGVQAGAKELLLAARRSPGGRYKAMRGLVADLFRIQLEKAPLVDLVLGDKAQYLVLDADPNLAALFERESQTIKGRVGFLPLDRIQTPLPAELDDFAGQPGVVGRADRYVECAPDLVPLARHLLGRTWIVEQLSHALQLVGQARFGTQFVTMAGEVVSADGSVVLGPRPTSGGLFSRRSELRVLRQLIGELEATVGQVTLSITQLEGQMAFEEERLTGLAEAHEKAVETRNGHRLRTSDAQMRWQQAADRRGQLQADAENQSLRLDTLRQSLATCRGERSAAQSSLTVHDQRLTELAARSETLNVKRRQLEDATLAAKIDEAKSSERLRSLRARRAQFERDQQERIRTIEEARTRIVQSEERTAGCRRQILAAESELALAYLSIEQLAREVGAQAALREQERVERTKVASQAQRARTKAHELEERHHRAVLAAHEVRSERQVLADRLLEDYAVDLAELDRVPSDEELREREAVDREIADLRGKIQNLGNVNLDALGELDDLEARYKHLAGQHEDLEKAKSQIVQIIERINADSRRLFAETLEAVKHNFQNLFRKLFGGGQADIVLEEGVDVLESGIEIVARPPGKEPRNISLLSGGEKTLTCVALLLSIFQYRPSPFCVLDEVDAALDEANIERFIGVLQEFLTWTQFIVVTHSKKTMTCASTLYGVTMEESGVSKRVAVRFEDVSDNGEFRKVADKDEEQAA